MDSWISPRMFSKSNWSRLILGRPAKVVATATLAFLGVVASFGWPGLWILALACAALLILQELMIHRCEGRRSNRLGQSHGIILDRVLTLIADLSDLTAREFDLWVVDLYLPSRSSVLYRAHVCRLELSLHIALTDVRSVSNRIDLDHAFFGPCFNEHRSELWWDVALAPSSEENYWERLDDTNNDHIRTEYGVVSASPIIDNLREDCRGLLVVHAAPDAETVTKVLGALMQPEGRRRVAAACVDIQNHLRESQQW